MNLQTLRARLAATMLCVAMSSFWLGCGEPGGGGPEPADGALRAPSAGEANPDASQADEPPGWVHRFVPKGLDKYDPDEDRWRPGSEVTRTRETEPGMVIYEVSEYAPGTNPTAEQRRAAEDFAERCYEVAKRRGWDRFEQGLADGYRSVDRHHYRKDEYMLDDRVLDPEHPEVLMYYETPPMGNDLERRHRLAGFMFYAKNRDARGPQIGGPLTIWHYHSWFRAQCVVDGLSVNWSAEGKCLRGTPSYFSGEMMHVWLVDRPEGRFATPMYIPSTVLVPLLEDRIEERGF